MASNANNNNTKLTAKFSTDELEIASYLATEFMPGAQYCGLDLPIGEKVVVPLEGIVVPDVKFLLEQETLKVLRNPAKAARSQEGAAILRKALSLASERLELHFADPKDDAVFYTMYPTWCVKNILRTKNGGTMFFAVEELFKGFNSCYSISADELRGSPAHVFLRIAEEMDKLVGRDLTALGVVSEKTGFVNYHYNPKWIEWYLSRNDESGIVIK